MVKSYTEKSIFVALQGPAGVNDIVVIKIWEKRNRLNAPFYKYGLLMVDK